MSQCVQFRGFRFSFGNISQLGHNKTFFFIVISSIWLLFLTFAMYPKLETRISVCLSILCPSRSDYPPPGFWNGVDWRALVKFLDFGFFYELLYFFWIFRFFCLDFLLPKVTKVSTDHRKLPKKNGPKQHNKLFFVRTTVSSKGQSPPQELEVGPHSGRIF